MEPTTNKTTKIEAAALSAAPEKSAKAAKGKKPAVKSKAAKEPKPKKMKPPKRDDLVVFAFRLPVADRGLIHKAAGPGKATRFVLAAALAAANGDAQAFKSLVEGRASNK